MTGCKSRCELGTQRWGFIRGTGGRNFVNEVGGGGIMQFAM